MFAGSVLSVFSLILALPAVAIGFGSFDHRAVVLSESGLVGALAMIEAAAEVSCQLSVVIRRHAHCYVYATACIFNQLEMCIAVTAVHSMGHSKPCNSEIQKLGETVVGDNVRACTRE